MHTRLKEIKNYAQKIKKRFNPQKIILFGSYAHGKPTDNSDVDLLVIVNIIVYKIYIPLYINAELSIRGESICFNSFLYLSYWEL